MRLLLAIIFFGLSAWITYSDWQATMSVGEAFRFSSVEAVWLANSPETHAEYLPQLQASTIPMLWDPVLRIFLTLPAAIVLFVLSALFWLIRKRKPPQKMNYIE